MKFLQQIFKGGFKHLGKGDDLDVGDKPLAAFDSLNGIFVQVDPHQLHAICQFPLGNFQSQSKLGNVFATYVVATVGRFIDKHKKSPCCDI